MSTATLERKRVVTAKDWAGFLGWSVKSVHHAAARGTFPGRIKVGRRSIWPPDAIERFIEAGQRQGDVNESK